MTPRSSTNSVPKWIAMLSATMGVAVFLLACSQEQKKEAIGRKVFDFLASADRARIKASNRPMVDFGQATLANDASTKAGDRTFVEFGQEVTINNDKRTILYQHPFSQVVFDDVFIPENAVLHFGIGINPAVWTKPGDGVSFEITVVTASSARPRVMIFAQYLDPKNKPQDRKWFDHNVDLSVFSGQKVSFIFATDAGPRNDSTFDWAGWSDLQVALRPIVNQ